MVWLNRLLNFVGGVLLWWTEEKAERQMQAVARNVNGGEGDLLADLGEQVRER